MSFGSGGEIELDIYSNSTMDQLDIEGDLDLRNSNIQIDLYESFNSGIGTQIYTPISYTGILNGDFETIQLPNGHSLIREEQFIELKSIYSIASLPQATSPQIEVGYGASEILPDIEILNISGQSISQITVQFINDTYIEGEDL